MGPVLAGTYTLVPFLVSPFLTYVHKTYGTSFDVFESIPLRPKPAPATLSVTRRIPPI